MLTRTARIGTMLGLLVAVVGAIVFLLSDHSITPHDTTIQQEVGDKQLMPLRVKLLISMTPNNAFFATLVEGANSEAKEENITLEVDYAESNPELQRSQIQAILKEKTDAVLLNPVDQSVLSAIIELNQKGIPLFTIDRSLNGGSVRTHIASDNIAGGEMAGEYVASILNRRGLVVELQGTPRASATADRGDGFKKAIAQYENIQVIDQQSGNFSRDTANVVFQSLLEKHPHIDAVFAHNDDMALGAIDAAKKLGRDKEIKFVGFDATADALAAIEGGDLVATVAQRPAEVGRQGVNAVARFMRGEAVSPSIPVDLALITE